MVTDVIVPASPIDARNRSRVLINLHGGGFTFGARYKGQVGSIPIASLGGWKIVTIDYRMAPENSFPAATEDIVAVYEALLADYEPQNIGIYGAPRELFLRLRQCPHSVPLD